MLRESCPGVGATQRRTSFRALVEHKLRFCALIVGLLRQR